MLAPLSMGSNLAHVGFRASYDYQEWRVTDEEQVMLSRVSHRHIVMFDVAVVAWILFCLMLGIGATKRVNRLGKLGDGLISAGNSVSGVGGWIGGLSQTPVVGGTFGSVADKINALGSATVQQGRDGKEAIWKAALGIGLLITLVPTLPVLAVWVPLRIGVERERSSLRAALKAKEPGVWEYLALQAIEDMSFRDIRKISVDPWEDVRKGRFAVFARLEIDRMGLASAAGEPPSREA